MQIVNGLTMPNAPDCQEGYLLGVRDYLRWVLGIVNLFEVIGEGVF